MPAGRVEGAMGERHPWDRQGGETAKGFGAFELFRRLGPDRTVQAAWEQYFLRPGGRRERGTKGAGPAPGYFKRWSARWEWHQRAVAWDEEVAAMARDQELDRELREKAREHEEEIRQRQLWKEEARAARTVARRLLLRALQGIEAQEIETMGVREILPHLQRISSLLEAGQRLERMALGEATDRTAVETTPGDQTKRDLADIIVAELEGADVVALEALRERLLAIRDGSQTGDPAVSESP